MGEENQQLRLIRPPVEGAVLSATRRQRLIAVAHDATALSANHAVLRGLAMAGHTILLMWLTGRPGTEVDFVTERHPLRRSGAEKLSFVEEIDRDPQAMRELAAADGVIGFGTKANEQLEELRQRGATLVPTTDLRRWVALGRTWQQLQARADADQMTPGYARNLAKVTAILCDPPPQEALVPLTDLLAELERVGDHREAVALLDLLRPGDPDPVEAARRRAVIAQVRTSAASSEDPDLRASTTDLLAVADAVLADGDVTRAAALATVGLTSLFHAELHADGLSSPLVDEPDVFLGPWRESHIGQLLAAPAPPAGRREESVTSAAEGGESPGRVLVAPGSYPRFAELVIADLRERPDVDVEVLDWEGRSDAIGLGVRGDLVETRLRQALGEDVRDPDLMAHVADTDHVLIDWADRGAVLTLMHLPRDAHVTLRVHSMDSLSAWLHLIDWSAVDDMVFVSEHLRDVTSRLLGHRLDGTRTHVIGNAVDLARIPDDKTEGHRHRLLMVGWAPRVKDVEWALDVLDLLRADDDRWTLTLVGAGISSRKSVLSSVEHSARVRARLEDLEAVGAVERIPATPDLAPYWRAAGFVLNTSRRESFSLAVVEGAAARAIPVVRNWPIFAGVEGARRLFPAEWVVDTVEEAAERIRSRAGPDEWRPAAEASRAFVEELFLTGDPAAALGDLVLGRDRADTARRI